MTARVILTLSLLLCLAPCFAQVADSSSVYDGGSAKESLRKPDSDFFSPADSLTDYVFNWKLTILPASLIGTGTVALAPSIIATGSSAVTSTVIDIRGSGLRRSFDDYIQYIPLAGSLLLGCTGIRTRHIFRDRALILGTSYAALAVLVNVPKALIKEKRPQFDAYNSFPSGHTATAFMGAELVRIEYGGWYAVGAYFIAGGVGFMRMYNGRHHFHDVVAGAGVGILSARIGEWSCNFWQRVFSRKGSEGSLAFTPFASPFDDGCYGLAMQYSF